MQINTPFSLLWSVLALSLALLILARDHTAPANRALGRFFIALTWWAFCEFLWNNAATETLALKWLHIGMPGFLSLGGLYLAFVLRLTEREALLHRRWFNPFAYGVPILIGVAAVTISPLWEGLTRTSWGWGYRPTALYALWFSHLAACFTLGIWNNFRYLIEARSVRVRRKASFLLVASMIPIVAGSLTDAILPLLDIQVFRLASLAATVMLGIFIYAMVVYREPLVSPQTVSSEILATIPDAVLLIDNDGRLVYSNAAAALLAGRTPESLQGLPIEDLLEVPSEALKMSASGPGSFGDLHNAEVFLRDWDGKKVPVALSTSALVDDNGDFVGLAGVARDLRAERRLKTQVARSDRLAAIGRLASGIGHEINNPITYVSMNLRSLRSEIDGCEKAAVEASAGGANDRDIWKTHVGQMRELLDDSIEGAARINEIVQNMRRFSSMSAGKLSRTDLKAEMTRALSVADPEVKAHAKVHLDVVSIPSVMARTSELQQVLVNLLINATQAISGYGNIWIRMAQEGGWASLEIEDDGSGIDPEVMPYIFDPYFTTKEGGTGTGLGLAIAYQLIEGMGGRIAVRAARRAGTVFRLELPLAAI
ncbi:MAG: ATP-binding protein [Deltaproteobacteria bacterium]|nr:ATP-binding protein [Deltaproteobacteria bacterium]